jgi:hypothetical protein
MPGRLVVPDAALQPAQVQRLGRYVPDHPANGLRDHSVTLTGKLPKVKALPRLTYTVAHHWFDADLGGAHYGKEINASLGLTTGRSTGC